MSDDILVKTFQDGLITLRLNRPDNLNSFNQALLIALKKAFADIAVNDDIRAVMITGTGRGFCAGADLGELGDKLDTEIDMGDGLRALYDPVIKAIADLPKPVIAAVNGVAAGAGCSMALGCDIVIAAEDAPFLLAFARIGVVADMGATWHLPRLAGQAKAMGLALLADQISAAEAERLGMIWKVVPAADLEAEATAIALRLAKAPTQALASMKQMIRASFSNTLDSQLELEANHQSLASKSSDFREGVRSFLEKRAPVYKGH